MLFLNGCSQKHKADYAQNLSTGWSFLLLPFNINRGMRKHVMLMGSFLYKPKLKLYWCIIKKKT